MILDMSMFQYVLFSKLKDSYKELKPGYDVQVFPTTTPSPNFFQDFAINNPIQYAKFISSVYRVNITDNNGKKYRVYFFFRNKKSKSDSDTGFVWPSSVDIYSIDDSGVKDKIVKRHYFGQESDCMISKSDDSPEFDDTDDGKRMMKSAIVSMAGVLVADIMSAI